MICIVVIGPTLEEAREQIKQSLIHADVVELRLDHFKNYNSEALIKLKEEFSIPMIFTLRSQLQGGFFKENQDSYLIELKKLAACKPAYLDLEAQLPHAFMHEINQSYPHIKLIISHHDMHASEDNLEPLLESMPKLTQCFYKIASMAHSTSDTLRVMLNAKKFQNLISISMGETGEISRILAPKIGSQWTYACLDKNHTSAPGQIPASLLTDVYRYKSINPQTELYGLIGDPITGSIGHLTNNAVMKAFNLNAVYVKMKIELNHLQENLECIKKLGFRGLAVTMPLKEAIIPLLDDMDPEAKAIGAVSFVHIDQGRLIGYNKDGYGALESLEQVRSVKGKRLIILGAGGASRAIAYEAKQRGAEVIILNRSLERAEKIADDFGCEMGELSSMQKFHESGYDFLINCTPYYLQQLPIDANYFLKSAIVMDITTKPRNTMFLKAAQAAGCQTVQGYQMFVRQTQKQFEVWFSQTLNEQKVFEVLNETALNELK